MEHITDQTLPLYEADFKSLPLQRMDLPTAEYLRLDSAIKLLDFAKYCTLNIQKETYREIKDNSSSIDNDSLLKIALKNMEDTIKQVGAIA